MKIILSQAEHAALLTKAEELEADMESAQLESNFPIFERFALEALVCAAVMHHASFNDDKVVVEVEGAAQRAFEEKLYGHNAPHLQAAGERR